MFDTVTAFIEQHRLLPESGSVVVAVSGGADSLCLLHMLTQLCGPGKRYPAIQLLVAHLDHQLRAEVSTLEAAAVAELARSWGLPVTIGVTDVPKLAREEGRSLEDAARTARYRFLREVAAGAPIAVAHHQDDQVETLVLHWLRGGGINGMIGLQPRQQDIVRPLLCVTHADTLTYCREHHLTPIEDASNADTRFLRNRIRHELIPLLQSINPGIRSTLLRNAEVLSVDAAWIEQQIDALWPTIVQAHRADSPSSIWPDAINRTDAINLVPTMGVDVRVSALLELPLSLQRHLLRRVTALLCDGQSPLALRHYRLLEQLVQREQTSAPLSLDLPAGLQAIREEGILTFFKVDRTSAVFATQREQESILLSIPGRGGVPGTPWIASVEEVPEEQIVTILHAIRSGERMQALHLLDASKYAVYIDADTVGDTLTVRTRRAGDRMRPLGMSHEKKVQDILVDRHIPRAERAILPIFFTQEHAVWLAGICLDDRVRVTSKTRRIVRLRTEIQSEE